MKKPILINFNTSFSELRKLGIIKPINLKNPIIGLTCSDFSITGQTIMSCTESEPGIYDLIT